jgi:L-asparaginase II
MGREARKGPLSRSTPAGHGAIRIAPPREVTSPRTTAAPASARRALRPGYLPGDPADASGPTPCMEAYSLDVIVTRGPVEESRHRVHAAVVDDSLGTVGRARDPHLVAPWRSCAKPFQLLPLLESGGIGELGWGDEEVALACASHGGEPEHLAVVGRMLHTIGLEEGDLACGAHEPMSRRGARLLREAGALPTRLHNNCSGKHAAMLARAHLAGWSTHGYEREGHPVQNGCLAAVARWTEVPAGDIPLAVDGCGVVVFVLPLTAMALAYARFAQAARDGEAGPARIVGAMRANPFLVGGTDRFDTVLMEETQGSVISKIGAEGVHSVALVDRGIGAAIKVEDGSSRAQYPAVLRLLQVLGALPDVLSPRLAELAVPRLRNTRGEAVGEVHVTDA